ncbi:MAG TPA: hypothetical protein DCY88_13620 [Cyanobacteria bacterium UBA11372]|nr:hypothetical protein [Cyanobacteria bacterium UBA11372]
MEAIAVSWQRAILAITFKCTNCRKPFSEELDFVAKRQKYTKRYTVAIMEKVIKSDLRNVAIQNN